MLTKDDIYIVQIESLVQTLSKIPLISEKIKPKNYGTKNQELNVCSFATFNLKEKSGFFYCFIQHH